MRKTHLILISVLITLLCSISHAAAGRTSLVRDFSLTSQRIQALLYIIRDHFNNDLHFAGEVEQLQSFLTGFRVDGLLLSERFRQQAALAGAAGGSAMDRQSRMAGRYEQLLAELLPLLEQLSNPATIGSDQLERSIELLDQLLPQQQNQLHGQLPYLSPEPVTIPLQLEPVVVPAYRQMAAAASADDLMSSPAAPYSALISEQAQQIAAQAQKLNWDPVDLYEWVKNNIETEWYRGCMKGAEETLRQRSGNAADQSALLIALLRAAGYPARYVRGVIEFFPGMESLQSLTGIREPVGIGDFFRKAGIPCEPVMDGDRIVNYRIEHVWVEAQIPYANYRGAMGDDGGKLWLPLDTSIKVAGFEEAGSTDLYAAEAALLEDLRSDYLVASQSLTPLEAIRAAAENYLAENSALTPYAELLHARQQKPEHSGLLSPGLQFTEIAVTGEYVSLPPELVHSVEFRIDGDATILQVTLPVHDLSNRKIVLGFEPESVVDHATINLWGGLDNTPAYLVRLRPVLLVDDQPVGMAAAGLAPGESFDLTIRLNSPSMVETTVNRVLTGYPQLIGVVAQQAVVPTEMAAEAVAADYLKQAALDYVARWNRGEHELSELLNLRLARPLPTLVSLGGVLDVVELLGEPQEISLKGLFIDADLRATAVEQRTGADDGRARLFMQLSALHGSVLEDRLFSENYGLAAISTASLFGLANDSGVPILSIDAGNAAEQLANLPYDMNVKADIADAVNHGWTVQIPAEELTFRDWSGIGYIKQDPLSGAAGYMLAGMTAGGSTVTSAEAWSDLLKYLFKYPLSLPPNADPDAAYSLMKIAATDMQTGVVGQSFDEPLTVYVRDSQGVPVRNASVTFTVLAGGGQLVDESLAPPVQGTVLTVPTDWRGLARVNLVAGSSTTQNTVSWHADQDTYATWASRQTVAASLPGGLSLMQPFTATALPDAPHAMTTLTAGTSGSILQYAGTVGASVNDRFGNPVANVPVSFAAAPPTPNSGLCDPAAASQEKLTAQLTAERNCISKLPGWGECAVSGPVTGHSMSNGIVSAGVVLGSYPDGIYPVTAAYAGPALPSAVENLTFLNSSAALPGGSCGAAVPPLSYFTLQREDYPVRPAGRPVALKVKMQMFAEGESPEPAFESLSCPEDSQQCPQVAGTGSFERITPLDMQVSIAGQPAVKTADAAGIYAANVSLELGEQNLAVAASASRRVALYDNSCQAAGGCAGQPTTQTREFTADWQISYTGVAIGGLPDIQLVDTGEDGMLLHDTPVSFAILPADYAAISCSFLLYQDGYLVMSVPTAVTGTPSATLPRGFTFDPGSYYQVAVVLNYGWDEAEIWSERVPVSASGFEVRAEGTAGTWLTANEMRQVGVFLLLNNDLEAVAGLEADDEIKALEILLPAVGGAARGSWSFTAADAEHLALYDRSGALLTPGQLHQVSLPAAVRLYAEGLAESAGLKSDNITLRFVPEGFAAQEQSVPVTVLNLDMAVDGNRDRAIKVQDPEDESFLFWVNNDYDDSTCVEVETSPETCEENDLNIELEDARDNLIRTRRDLEDFARLQLAFGGNLAAGTLAFSLRTEGMQGEAAPQINLFKAVDSTDKYLGFDLGPQDRQPDLQLLEKRLAMVAPQGTPLASDWLIPGQVSPFLFEGLSAGRGDLVLTASHLGVPVIEKRVHMDIREMAYFYDHFMLDATGDDLQPVAADLRFAREAAYAPVLDEYVLLVHGWNMQDWEKRRYAETMFKRLWWHGYQGRMGLFDWPCRTLPSLDFQVNFDRSEYRAWHAAAVLARLLTDADRPPGGSSAGQVRLLAHSQGNVVAGEAINLAPAGTVHSYVASQAALSASFYHPETTDFLPQLEPFIYDTPDVYSVYPSILPPATYLKQVPQKVYNGNIFSYFNEKDYALTIAGAILPAWEYNNRTRPDNSIGYDYLGDPAAYPDPPADGEGFVKRDYQADPVTGEVEVIFTRQLLFPADRYEIFAYGAESRAKALGAVQAPPGFSPQSKDLYALFGFDDEEYSHSRQFKSNIIDEMGYWTAFADDVDLTLLGNVQEN